MNASAERRAGRLGPVLLVVAITIAGAVLRFAAVDFGLPDRCRPDEQFIVEKAAVLGGTHGFNPRFAMYPAAQTYLDWALGRLAQAIRGERWTLEDPEGRRRWYLTGRLASAVMGTLTIPLTAAVAANAAGWPAHPGGLAAVLGAGLLAGTFLHVRDSHFATTDVAMTFWAMLAWLAIARVVRRGRLADSTVAGALVGLAAATKYPAIGLAVPLALAHVLGTRRPLRLAGAAVAVAATFFIATPYVVLDRATTDAAIAMLKGLYVTTGRGGPTGFGWLFGAALPAAFGWPLAAFLVASIGWALVAGGVFARLLAVWLLVAAYPLVTAHLVMIRYVVPVATVGVALIGAAMARLSDRLPGGRIAVALLALVAVAPSVARAIALDRFLAQTDTRTLARVWMEKNLPRGTVVYAPAYHPVPVLRFALPEASPPIFRYAPVPDRPPAGAYVLIADHPAETDPDHATPPSLAAALDARATVLLDVDPFRKPNADGARYEPLDAFYVPLWGFDAVERPGPRLRLYRLTS